MGHPVVGADRVGLHQRHDHEAAPEGERADLQGRPRERSHAGRLRCTCQQRPEGAGARGEAACEHRQSRQRGDRPGLRAGVRERGAGELGGAAGEQHQHEPRAGEGRAERAGEGVQRAPAGGPRRLPGSRSAGRLRAPRARPRPRRRPPRPRPRHGATGGGEADRNRTDSSEDQREPGGDEAETAEQRSGRSAQPPRAVDRELRGGGPGQDVDRGERPLELIVAEPVLALHAQLAQQGDVSGWAAEADAARSAPTPARSRPTRGLDSSVAGGHGAAVCRSPPPRSQRASH